MWCCRGEGANYRGWLWGTQGYICPCCRRIKSRGLRMAHRERNLRLLESCRLGCQRLLRNHQSSTRVAASSGMRGLGLAGHLHGMPWNTRNTRLTRYGLVLCS